MAANNHDADSLSSDDRNDRVTHIITSKKMMKYGLEFLYTVDRVARGKASTNLVRFRKNFGINPATACDVYEDMQKTDVQAARVEGCELNLKFFLITLYFLRKYPDGNTLEAVFDYSPGYIAAKIWDMVCKIHALKEEKITFPTLEEIGTDIWVMSVDGTHVWMKEKMHEEWSLDPKQYSHKYNKAGRSYELGISLTAGLIWMNGPYPGGTNDITIFRQPGGLKEKLEQLGKMAIGDRGYRGEKDLVSYPNAVDTKSVHMFKSRALCRHESFNGLTKVFDILSGRFRHSEKKFEKAFEAVCVLCQYKLEKELPLYDIYIQAVEDAAESDDEDDDDQEED
jgi:hypothetical protein